MGRRGGIVDIGKFRTFLFYLKRSGVFVSLKSEHQCNLITSEVQVYADNHVKAYIFPAIPSSSTS